MPCIKAWTTPDTDDRALPARENVFSLAATHSFGTMPQSMGSCSEGSRSGWLGMIPLERVTANAWHVASKFKNGRPDRALSVYNPAPTLNPKPYPKP